MTHNIYESCPTYETSSFLLRPVRPEDAEALLTCYSDPQVVAKCNADNCYDNFYYTNLSQMTDCINSWIREYKEGHFVRFALLPKGTNTAVGTMEISGGGPGVLRIDLAAGFDNETQVEELLRLTVFRLIPDFQVKALRIKTENVPDRVPLLQKYGFVPTRVFRPGVEYYERTSGNFLDKKKGLAYCGLACCVCSENKDCNGCRNGSCTEKDWCTSFALNPLHSTLQYTEKSAC